MVHRPLQLPFECIYMPDGLSRTKRLEKQRLELVSLIKSAPHITSASMYFGLPVFTICDTRIFAQFVIFVGFCGSQLPPPPITGISHQRPARFGSKKKSSASPMTVLTCPLF